jgi:hypothetical protein
LTIKGAFNNNYLKTDEFDLETTVWSPCGEEGLLNINSEVRLTPLDSDTAALLTVRRLNIDNLTAWINPLSECLLTCI